MKKLYFMAVAIVCLMASCSQNDMFEQEFKPTLNATGEVLFSAATNEGTRTEYDHSSYDGASIAVKWLDGDKITVYGTNCASGREQATYKVTPHTTAGGTTTADRFYYADKLTSTGAYGVQWGEADASGVVKSDFYAVYPSIGGAMEPTVNEDGVVVPMSIDYQQYNTFSVNGNTIQGTPYNSITRANGMNDAIMYACTKNAVAGTDDKGNPKAVDLKFKPYSTVLKFTIPTWKFSNDSNPAGKKIVITTIALTAPENVMIAGNFNLTIKNDGTATADKGTANTIAVLSSTGTIEWEYGKSLEFSIFAIPLSGLNLNDEWTVTIGVQGESARKIKLTPTFAKESGLTTATLDPGKIHELKITSNLTVAKEWEYDLANWITTIPRNVYISDLSLPGSWYACDGGYQDGSLEAQFKAGIRAFNIDSRLSLANGASRESSYDMEDYTSGRLVLTCAGTESTTSSAVSSRKTVEEAIVELAGLLKDHQDEYIEVILTVSQKAKTDSSRTYGTVDAQMMLRAIADVLNKTSVSQYIYGGTDEEGNPTNKSITPNTTLNDVLGKMVVKVNVNTSDDNIRSWNYSAPMLISNGSMAASASGNIVAGVFNQMNTTPMYWSNNYITETANAGYMTFYYHQAQQTYSSGSTAPTLAQRQTAIEDIISKSYAIYADNTHDAMFQIGIGGWVKEGGIFGLFETENKGTVSASLKPYVYNIINSMLNGTAYNGKTYTPAPVGAVLMNHATAGSEHNTDALIKAIVDLNGKYFLNRDTSKPAWPEIPGSGENSGEQDDPSDEDGGGTNQPEV